MKKNIILASLKETFSLIRKHKLLVLALFILQVLFFSALTIAQIKYQVVIAGNLQSMTEYFDNLNLDDEAVAEKILQKKDILDMSGVYGNYDIILRTLKSMVITTFFIFALLNGINWAFTDRIIARKSVREFFIHVGKFFLISLFYGILILVIILSFMKTSFADLVVDNNIGPNLIYFVLGLVVLYFMFISFALVGRTTLKDIFRKTFLIGIKKAHIILLAYIINIAVVDLLFFLLYLAIDWQFWILLIITIFFFFSFILARIFLLLVVEKLNKEIK